MGLYSKKLNGLDELKKEKELLAQQSEKLFSEDFLSDSVVGMLGQIKGKKDKKEVVESKSQTKVSAIEQIVPLLLPLLETKKASTKISGDEAEPDAMESMADGIKKKMRGILFSVGKEVLGGYLKWKAIEISFKIIRKSITKKQEVKKGQVRIRVK